MNFCGFWPMGCPGQRVPEVGPHILEYRELLVQAVVWDSPCRESQRSRSPSKSRGTPGAQSGLLCHDPMLTKP